MRERSAGAPSAGMEPKPQGATAPPRRGPHNSPRPPPSLRGTSIVDLDRHRAGLGLDRPGVAHHPAHDQEGPLLDILKLFLIGDVPICLGPAQVMSNVERQVLECPVAEQPLTGIPARHEGRADGKERQEGDRRFLHRTDTNEETGCRWNKQHLHPASCVLLAIAQGRPTDRRPDRAEISGLIPAGRGQVAAWKDEARTFCCFILVIC